MHCWRILAWIFVLFCELERGSDGTWHKAHSTHIYKVFNFMFPEVTADLGCKQNASTSAQFAVLFVEFALEDELLEVNVSHGDSNRLQTALFTQVPHLPL